MLEMLVALCLSLSGLGYFSLQAESPLNVGNSSKFKILTEKRATPLGEMLIAINNFAYEDIKVYQNSEEEHQHLKKSPSFLEESDLANYAGRDYNRYRYTTNSNYTRAGRSRILSRKKGSRPIFICKSTRCRQRMNSVVKVDPIGCGPELNKASTRDFRNQEEILNNYYDRNYSRRSKRISENQRQFEVNQGEEVEINQRKTVRGYW